MLAGIFIGGASRRMGGRPKGLLVGPGDESLVERWRRIFDRAGIACVLVGRRPEYAGLGLPILDDEPAGIGPLGGLAPLLRAAQGAPVIAVACDMPFVTADLVSRLVDHPRRAPAVAARRDGRWEPLFARYAADALPVVARRAQGQPALRSLQGLLDELGADELPLAPEEHRLLRDWDSPCDMDGA